MSNSPCSTQRNDQTPSEHEAVDSRSTSPAQTAYELQRGDDVEIARIPTAVDSLSTLEHNETEFGRIQTGRGQHYATVGASKRSRTEVPKSLPPFGAGKPYPRTLPAQEEYVVEFDGVNDPLHPHNWPLSRKIHLTSILTLSSFTAAFDSAIFAAAVEDVSDIYGVANVVGRLGISLFILGFTVGPILWAPASELYGRRVPLVIASFGFFIFSFAVAAAKDIQTVLICRFWNGFFGACFLAVAPAVMSDIYTNRTRGTAIAIFVSSIFCGPFIASFVGGYITESHLGWRWTQYLVGIMGAFEFLLLLFFLRESYPPVVLVNKAALLRRRTLNWGIHAKQEEIEVHFRELLEKNLSRPLRMLFTEPIVALISVYMAFIFGLLFLTLTAYPQAFGQVRQWRAGDAGLPTIGVIVGLIMGCVFIVLRQPGFNRKLEANGNSVIPEWRLPEAIIGGVLFALGIFWFGWTGFTSSIHWAAPTLSGLFIGFGILTIFQPLLNYLIDAYLMFAASAVAANTIARSFAGASFAMFATFMYDGMGIQWANTLLGCLAAGMIPIPVVLYYKGAKIRERSSYAPAASQKPSSASSSEKSHKEA